MKILVIPDTQVRPGVPTDHLRWAGRYALEKKPDVIVHLGDHWDLPSLSSWDRGKVQFEGRRYKADIAAGNSAFRLLDEPIVDANRKRKSPYLPRKVFLRGNHENRIQRFVEEHGELSDMIGYDDMDTRDWEVHDFLKPVCIEGVHFAHYWVHPLTGKAMGGAALGMLKNLGHTFVQGHRQVYESANRFVAGKAQRAVIAGAYYCQDEEYKGYQANAHWRGILMLNEVQDGSFDISEVSINFLCQKFEKKPISEFLSEKYPDQGGTLWN